MTVTADPVAIGIAEPQRRTQGFFGAMPALMGGAWFGARLGVNGMFPFPVTLLTTPLALGWMIFTGAARLSWTRLGFYLAMLTGVVVSYLLAQGKPAASLSLPSMMLYIGLFAMFLFPVELSRGDYQRYFRIIANVASVLCLIGAAQYVAQFILHQQWIFSWRGIVPDQFLIEYNTLNETKWSSGIFKANGFFLLEASHLSQLGARALLISIIILRDPRYLAPLLIGMVTTYSGTGLILAGMFGIIPLLTMVFRDRKLAPFGVVGLLCLPAILIAVWEPLNLGLFVARLGEFTVPHSSAYARFLSGGAIFQAFSHNDFLTIMFGAGPGMIERYLADSASDVVTFGTTWIKLVVDYGVFGFAAFCLFFCCCVYTTTRSKWLTAAFLFHFTYLDGGLLVPQQVFTALIMGCLVTMRPADIAAEKLARKPMRRAHPMPWRQF